MANFSLFKFNSIMQFRRIFGKRTLSTSSRNVWSLSWVLKAEEGWGEIKISTKGIPTLSLSTFTEIKHESSANYR